jgi:hypothetical protein
LDILLHGGVAVDVSLHRAVVGSLYGEKGGIGRDCDQAEAIVVNGDPVVVNGIEVIG